MNETIFYVIVMILPYAIAIIVGIFIAGKNSKKYDFGETGNKIRKYAT